MQGEIGAVDAVGEAGAVSPVQYPAHRLAVGDQQVEVIEAELVLGIEHPGHHAVHGERRNRGTLPLARRAEDERQAGLVVDGVDQHADDILFA